MKNKIAKELTMTPSQAKQLKYHQGYDSYRSHYMKGKNLIIQCETVITHEWPNRILPYMLVIGIRGGKTQLTYVNGEWKVI